jgi:hypothetical protein
MYIAQYPHIEENVFSYFRKQTIRYYSCNKCLVSSSSFQQKHGRYLKNQENTGSSIYLLSYRRKCFPAGKPDLLHYFLAKSLLMNSSKAGSNHFPASIVFHISDIVPCSKALFIHRNHPVHSLSLTTPLCRI